MMGDHINPEHYKGEIECADVGDQLDLDRWSMAALKYLWRKGEKLAPGMTAMESEIEDINKCIWYLQRRIKVLMEG